MGKVVVYIACSLDGFVAGVDDEMAWLEAFNAPDEDHGYAVFMAGVGTVVMGRRTFDEAVRHPERHLAGVKSYVVSSRPVAAPEGVAVEGWSGELADLVARIRRESDRDVFVAGGGQLVSGFLMDGLVEEFRLFVAPVVLGKGIPLFVGIERAIGLRLVEAKGYVTGMVEMRYAG